PMAICGRRWPCDPAEQTGSWAAALRLAAGRSGPSVRRVAGGPAPGRAVRAADRDPAAAETANAGRTGPMAGGTGRPAARAGSVGRLALGRPDHAGAPRARGRAGAHGADAARPDVSAHVSPGLAATRPPGLARAQSPGTSAGRGADQPAGRWESATRRSGAAHRDQNGWGATLRRR